MHLSLCHLCHPPLSPLGKWLVVVVCLSGIRTAESLNCTVHLQDDGTALYKISELPKPNCDADWAIDVRTNLAHFPLGGNSARNKVCDIVFILFCVLVSLSVLRVQLLPMRKASFP